MNDEKTIAKHCYDLGVEKLDERPEFDAIKKSIEIYNVGKQLLKKQRCESCGKIINRILPKKKTIMASSIYIALFLTGQRRTQKTIAQSFDITIVPLAKHYTKIMALPGYKEEDKFS